MADLPPTHEEEQKMTAEMTKDWGLIARPAIVEYYRGLRDCHSSQFTTRGHHATQIPIDKFGLNSFAFNTYGISRWDSAHPDEVEACFKRAVEEQHNFNRMMLPMMVPLNPSFLTDLAKQAECQATLRGFRWVTLAEMAPAERDAVGEQVKGKYMDVDWDEVYEDSSMEQSSHPPIILLIEYRQDSANEGGLNT